LDKIRIWNSNAKKNAEDNKKLLEYQRDNDGKKPDWQIDGPELMANFWTPELLDQHIVYHESLDELIHETKIELIEIFYLIEDMYLDTDGVNEELVNEQEKKSAT
jgi:hypothetical protein